MHQAVLPTSSQVQNNFPSTVQVSAGSTLLATRIQEQVKFSIFRNETLFGEVNNCRVPVIHQRVLNPERIISWNGTTIYFNAQTPLK